GATVGQRFMIAGGGSVAKENFSERLDLHSLRRRPTGDPCLVLGAEPAGIVAQDRFGGLGQGGGFTALGGGQRLAVTVAAQEQRRRRKAPQARQALNRLRAG